MSDPYVRYRAAPCRYAIQVSPKHATSKCHSGCEAARAVRGAAQGHRHRGLAAAMAAPNPQSPILAMRPPHLAATIHPPMLRAWRVPPGVGGGRRPRAGAATGLDARGGLERRVAGAMAVREGGSMVKTESGFRILANTRPWRRVSGPLEAPQGPARANKKIRNYNSGSATRWRGSGWRRRCCDGRCPYLKIIASK